MESPQPMPVVRKRTKISVENLAHLNQLYTDGMTSRSAACTEHHSEACRLTNLPIKTILDWIGNKNKLKPTTGTTYKKKGLYTKGLSGFNLFVKQNKEIHPSMKSWSTGWNSLSLSAKEQYRAQAKQTPTETSKEVLLRKASSIMAELSLKHSINMVCCGFDASGRQYLFGEGKPLDYLQKSENFIAAMHSYCVHDINVRPDDKLVNFRKKAQTHINRLYGVAIGRNTEVNFPYKSYAEKKIILNNLPDSINPLKPPSQYGLVKLKEILSLTELIVSQNEEITHHLTSQTNTLSPPTNPLNSQPHTHTLPTLTSPTLPSPTQTVSSPTHTLTSPTLTSQTRLTYTHPLNSPTHTLNSPTHTLNLPMHTLTSPMHTFTSPMHTFTSPMHTHTSPTHTLTSPTHTLTSPTHTLPTHTSQMHPAEMEIDRNEYVVERIVRRRKKRNGKREYLLRWKGFTAKDDTWEKEENLNPFLLSIASNPKKSD